MPQEKVLLDLNEAQNIFHQLSIMHKALKDAGMSAHERSDVMRAMVKIKVAINKAES